MLQSEVFNQYITMRRAIGRGLISGEVVRLDGSRSVFVVEDAVAELPRFESGDIVRTGPMPGPKMRSAESDAAELEGRAVASVDVDADGWAFLGRHAPGTRRDLEVTPTDCGAEVAGPSSLVVHFTLPAGSYATQFARELTRLDWGSPLRPSTE